MTRRKYITLRKLKELAIILGALQAFLNIVEHIK